MELAGSVNASLLPEVAAFVNKHGLTSSAQDELQGLMQASVMLSQKKVTVSVPGSVANLGPGIEVVGMAIDIWDEFTLEYAEHFSIEVYGDAAAEVPRTDQNLVVLGAACAFQEAGRPVPPIRYVCTHRVPFNKGLGGPSASFVGGFLAGSVLCSEELRVLNPKASMARQDSGEVDDTPRNGTHDWLYEAVPLDGDPVPEMRKSPMSRPRLGSLPKSASLANVVAMKAADSGEQHAGVDSLLQATISRGWNPGNVCPAIYGALQIGIATPDGMRSHRVPIPHGLVCVLFVPDGQEEGKPLPPSEVGRKDAVFNLGRSACLINCFVTQDFAKFSKATEDCLTSNHINKNFPHIPAVSQAAMAAGAAGACPCGYGPSVLALIPGRQGDVLAQSASNQLEHNVAKAMLRAAEESGVQGQILIAKPADIGAHLVAQKSSLGAPDDFARIVYFQ